MTAVLHSNLSTDLNEDSRLSASLRILLADMASIRRTGAVTFLGSVNGQLTDTILERYAGLDGYDSMAAASSEGSDESTTALTDASASVAVARQVMRRDISDLARITDNGTLNVQRLAASMVGEYEQRFNSLVADAIDDFGTDVGASGVDMSVSNFFSAMYVLEIANVPGPYFAMLHPRQVADLQESLRSEGGAMQWMAATAEMLGIKGQGYAGGLLGVDIHKHSKVNTAGGNRHGAMWGLGALGYRVGIVPDIPNVQLIRADEIAVEFDRNGSAALTEVIGHAYTGVAILEDARGVGIVTDA